MDVVNIFLAFFVLYLITIVVHFGYFEAEHREFDKKDQDTPFHKYLKHTHIQWKNQTTHAKKNFNPKIDDAQHARLVCEGGDGSEQDLVYWHKATDFDDKWRSPWAPKEGESPKYVVFESDNGGWNNVRMAFEAIFVFARATGRTIVMPPDEAFYFPDPGVSKKDYFKNQNGYSDFFPLEAMKDRLGPDTVITMDEFLEREAYTGNLGKIPPVPLHQTGKGEGMRGRTLRDYLRSLSTAKEEIEGGIGGGGCLSEGAYAIIRKNSNINNEISGRVDGYFMPCFKEGGRKNILAFPDPNDSRSASEQLDLKQNQRLAEFVADRKVTLFDGHKWVDSKVIHFAAWPKAGYRMLMHFYTLFYFQDVTMDRRMKRFVRDHFRYHDTIWCAAARVLQLLKRDAPAEFSTYHVRHGEFQFKVVRLGAEDILNNSIDLLHEKELVYIATDEQDKESFFKPMRQKFTLKFLDDYMKEAKLEQVF